MEMGKGRVAIFAEGMMFSSQRNIKTNKVHGLRSCSAEQNARFLLNVMSWFFMYLHERHILFIWLL